MSSTNLRARRFELLLLLLVLLSSWGCGGSQSVDFSVDFGPWSGGESLRYELKADDAIQDGLSFPERGDADSLLRFSASIEGFEPGQELMYKVFYKNVSYANDEANGNFYGGWGDGDEAFRAISVANDGSCEIKGGIRIQGNPRNESKYFGAARENPNPNSDEITLILQEMQNTPNWLKHIEEAALKNGISIDDQMIKDAIWTIAHGGLLGLRGEIDEDDPRIEKVRQEILNTPDWLSHVKKEAGTNNLSLDDQLIKDAIWTITNLENNQGHNNRWKRNPRMGEYAFKLVVMTKAEYQALEAWERDLSIADNAGQFVDPFQFFDQGEAGGLVVDASQRLHLAMSIDVGRGLFVNRASSESTEWNEEALSDACSSNDEVFESAHWEQFYHGVSKDFYLKNIPVYADVVSEYTQAMYNENAERYPLADRDSCHFAITDSPCKTAYPDEQGLVLANPARSKEQVGVKTRIGMSYGTYTLKVDFPALLSDDAVWNGLTNAFWLIYESDASWNDRSPSETGYLAKEASVDNPGERMRDYHYSEIDIEIVKTREPWFEHEYDAEGPIGKDITVSFTNWDMCDGDVEDFILYGQDRETAHGEYHYHRWHEYYNAITVKQNFDHDEIFEGPYYYFQIEWHPDHITWRKGPEKDQLEVFGYMDETMTSIPDNQMLAVVTQEFHADEWWPRAPFGQNDIPFPARDLIGHVLELTVE